MTVAVVVGRVQMRRLWYDCHRTLELDNLLLIIAQVRVRVRVRVKVMVRVRVTVRVRVRYLHLSDSSHRYPAHILQSPMNAMFWLESRIFNG